MNNLKTRKFLLALFIMLLSSFMIWFGKIDQNVWKDIIWWVFAFFIGGNAIEKLTGLKKGE